MGEFAGCGGLLGCPGDVGVLLLLGVGGGGCRFFVIVVVVGLRRSFKVFTKV